MWLTPGSMCPTASELQAAFFEADVLSMADHQVVEHLDVHHPARFDQRARGLHVFRTKYGVAAGMVVPDDLHRGVVADRIAKLHSNANKGGVTRTKCNLRQLPLCRSCRISRDTG